MIFYKNSSLVFKSRCENLFSHISQWNPVCYFIQSYEYLIRIHDLFSNLDSTRCKIESFVTKLFCPFKSRCKLECYVTYLKMYIFTQISIFTQDTVTVSQPYSTFFTYPRLYYTRLKVYLKSHSPTALSYLLIPHYYYLILHLRYI